MKLDPRSVYGKVRFVAFGEDYKVRVVRVGRDLSVRRVSMGAFSPGLWEEVKLGEDFKIRIVKMGQFIGWAFAVDKQTPWSTRGCVRENAVREGEWVA